MITKMTSTKTVVSKDVPQTDSLETLFVFLVMFSLLVRFFFISTIELTIKY